MSKLFFILSAALAASFTAHADEETFYLSPGCGYQAAVAATSKASTALPTSGTWFIQEFKKTTPAPKETYELVLHSNGGLVNGGDPHTLPCVKVVVQANAGATDCEIRSVVAGAPYALSGGLCR